MAAYPIITTGSSAVTITTSNSSLSYQMLIATLLSTGYKVKHIYIEASSLNQATTQFLYKSSKSTVQQKQNTFSDDADVNQFLPLINAQVSDQELILNNMSVVSFTLQPDAFIQMYFYTDAVSFNDKLGKKESINDNDIVLVPIQKNHNDKIIKILALTGLGIVLFYLLKDE